MSFFFSFLICFLVLSAAATATATEGREEQILRRDVFHVSKWEMQPTASSSFEALSLDPLVNKNKLRASYPFTAPATVLGTLVDQGVYPQDILQGDQYQKLDPTPFHEPWNFTFTSSSVPLNKLFPVIPSSPPSLTPSKYVLRFEGINYRADLSVNGKSVASEKDFRGTFRHFEFDVTDILLQEEEKPVQIQLQMYQARDLVFPLSTKTTDLALTTIDWNPHAKDRSLGIWQKVELIRVAIPQEEEEKETKTKTRSCLGEISDLQTRITLSSGSSPPRSNNKKFIIDLAPRSVYNNVSLTVDFLWTISSSEYSSETISKFGKLASSYSATCSVTLPQSKQVVTFPVFALKTPSAPKTTSPSPSSDAVQVEVSTQAVLVNNVLRRDLWWPHQLEPEQQIDPETLKINSEASRADVSCRFLTSKTDPSSSPYCSRSQHKIGLRESFSQIYRPPTSPSSVMPGRQFFINHVPIKVTGGGYNLEDLFLRNQDEKHFTYTVEYVRSMGLNTLRFEGLFVSSVLFDLLDKFGVMSIPGFSCCDAFQRWSMWKQEQYFIANCTLRDQVRRLRKHASAVAFLYSSDQLPPEKVEKNYLSVFEEVKWENIRIATASAYTSNISGPSGVKMAGPYASEPAIYWWQGGEKFLYGGAFGFGTELSAGSAPMVFSSQLRAVSTSKKPNNVEALYPIGSMNNTQAYHNANPEGLFYNNRFFDFDFFNRYSKPKTPFDYSLLAQSAIFETTRAYFESYNTNKLQFSPSPSSSSSSSLKSNNNNNEYSGKGRSAGNIQWMLNSAWPSSMWNSYDYFRNVGGNFFAMQQANSPEISAVFDYQRASVSVLNNRYSTFSASKSSNFVEVIVAKFLKSCNDGKKEEEEKCFQVVFQERTADFSVGPNQVLRDLITNIPWPSDSDSDLSFVYTYVEAKSDNNNNVSTNSSKIYWRGKQDDLLDWKKSNFYRTPTEKYADLSTFSNLLLSASSSASPLSQKGIFPTACKLDSSRVSVSLNRNSSSAASSFAFNLLVSLEDASTNLPLLPTVWSDNFVSLLPTEVFGNRITKESVHLTARYLDKEEGILSKKLKMKIGNETFNVLESC